MDYSTYLHLNSLSYFCYVDLVWKVEQWKDIPDYEGLYQVSDLGRIKSLPRLDIMSRIVKERILKQVVSDTGRYQVGLSKQGKNKLRKVHQLVMMAFLNHKPCGYKLVIDHKNNNHKINHLSNLQIITQRENANQKHLPSSSQYTGVTLKKNKKWSSSIWVNGSKLHLGIFDDEKEASKYYENALMSIKNGTEIKVKTPNYSSKYKGVVWDKNRFKWMARISINKKVKNLGRYTNELDAHLAVQRELKNPTNI